MASPCGGCPPCCPKCTFSPHPASRPVSVAEVVSREEYGCVRQDGGAVVISDGMLGMMRAEGFHPVTEAGAEFLRASKNPLAAYC